MSNKLYTCEHCGKLFTKYSIIIHNNGKYSCGNFECLYVVKNIGENTKQKSPKK